MCFLFWHDWEEVDRHCYLGEEFTIFNKKTIEVVTIITFRCKKHLSNYTQRTLLGEVKKN